jgi:hypothetical protein
MQFRVAIHGDTKMKAVDIKKIESADLQSIGYSAASQGDTMASLATELSRRYPNGLTDEAKAELEKGIVGRKAELFGTQYYLHKGSEYTLIKDPSKAGKDDAIAAFTVETAVSMTAYDFGQLKGKDKAKYDIIAAIRTATNKYRSNALGDLLRAIDRLKTGKGRTRGDNVTFAELITKTADMILTRAKNAKTKGDPSATTNKAELIKMMTDAINKA